VKGKILITGFDPFGGEKVNPAWEAVKRLPDRIGELDVYKMEIPTVFGLAAERVLARAEEVCPDVILCIGQAGGRSAVTPERIAVNIRDGKIADNAGNRPVGECVVPDGPAAYFATVPVREMADAISGVNLTKVKTLADYDDREILEELWKRDYDGNIWKMVRKETSISKLFGKKK
jgi:pyroglutamyl-peptidase